MDNPADLTASEAAKRIRAGDLTSLKLTEACLARIEQREEALQAWAYLDADLARAQAQAADDALAAGGPRSALHGVPVGIKDIIDTADMPTESGTPHFAGRRPERDAHCVALLRDAGAVILGKTVTTELASLAPSKSRNPVNPAHSPGGSSAGSGAAVGGGMVPLALGTQTGGSVIRPASFCGVHGLKPTLGFISRRGVTLQSHTLDTVGVYGRSLDDLALISDVLGAFDPDDDVAYPRGAARLGQAVAEAAPSGGYRIGFWKTPVWDRAEPRAQAAIEDFAGGLGPACREIAFGGGIEWISEDHQCVMSGENAHYYGPLYDKDKSLLTEQMRGRLEAAFAVSARQYLDAVNRREVHYEEVAAALDESDAILCLSSAGPAPEGFATTGDAIFNGLWTFLGVPCVSLPLLTVDGMPMGVQLVGKRREEDKLLRVAKWVEGQVAGRA